jgi:hypothetical protein
MEDLNSIEQHRYERAQKRVKAVTGFYKHLIVYIIVNCFLIGIKYFSLDPGEEFLEFGTFSTAFFWGFGLVFHAVGVFWTNIFFGHDWEERKIREIMEKQQRQKWE